MKRILKTLAAASAALAIAAPVAVAHDFSKTFKDGNTLHFTILDQAEKTVEVTYEGKHYKKQSTHPKGDLVISDFVNYDGKLYKVVSISDRAFYGADSLVSVTLPKTIAEIGDLAFAKCPVLRSVKLGDKQAELGDDLFYGSPAVEEIVFGKAWVKVDLGVFASCTELKDITIPASVKRIANLKKLASLEYISVEDGNTNFSSEDGLLYSKDKKQLFACPVSHSDSVYVSEGAEEILKGAFKGCEKLTMVVLPSTTRQFNYDEFEPLPALKALILNTPYPPQTATLEGGSVFAVRLPSSASLYVTEAALDVYRKAVCNKAGEYAYPGESETKPQESNGFVTRKGIKKFGK